MKPSPGSKASSQKIHQKSRIIQDTDDLYVETAENLNQQPTPSNKKSKTINLKTEGIETEIRRDYLNDNFVIIAPNRSKRPYDTKDNDHVLIETAQSARLDRNKNVCELNDSSGDWIVKVVENKFPSLSPDNPKAYGKQEIVIDTPLASTPFAMLSERQIRNVLHIYKKRITDLLSQNGIDYVLVFRNDGYGAGASLAHAHSQIFALPLIPQKFKRESEIVEAYFLENKRDPYEDIIAYEKRTKSRIVYENNLILVFCPYASLWPFELWIIPKRQVSSFENITDSEIDSIAMALKRYLKKLTGHKISFNMYLENGISPHQRFCLKICGRSNIWGGFEVASGIVINTVPPESAALWYKSK